MTGDAPQPGETARDDGSPWSPADPASPWWHPDRREAGTTRQHSRAEGAAVMPTSTLDPPEPDRRSGEAAEAGQAGAEDVHAALAPATVVAPAEPSHAQPTPVDKAVEHDHVRVDAERYNAADEGTVYAAHSRARSAVERGGEESIVELLAALEDDPAAGSEVMILPEPDRNRPTVALERTGDPGREPAGLSRLGRGREDRARADRALQDRIRQERTAALLETSPFWKAEEERRAQEAAAVQTRERPPGRSRPRRRAPRPRRPAAGLLGLLALGLVAAFFAWVSAEPFWLAVGHGQQGTATVTRCTGAGVTQRCTGVFTAANGAYRIEDLALLGVEPAQRGPGATVPARMVSSQSRQAYVGSTGPLTHLRWALGFALVLLCGLGIAGLTGAGRLDTAGARRGALVACMCGPLLLLAGFLALTY